jgi:hypothetical protein
VLSIHTAISAVVDKDLLEADGSIMTWGDSNNGGTSALSESGYTKIYSNLYAFAALKADGSITAWGENSLLQ